jgi:integrase
MKIGMRLFRRKLKGGKIGNYYVEVDSGKRRSLTTKDKVKARRMFRKLEREYLDKKITMLTGVQSKPLGEYRDEFLEWSENNQPYSTFRANRLALKKLIHQAGEKISLDRISLKHLDLMITAERKKGLKIRSINNYIRHARSSLNKAVEWKYVQRNPLAGAKELPASRTRPKFLTRNQVPRYIASIKDIDLRRLVVAYLATGRRRSELLRLKWKNIDFKKNRYTVTVKGGKKQEYPINKAFRAVLLAIGKKEGRVFDRWKHPDTLSHLVKAALVAAGYPNLSLHSLRHTYASMKVLEGRSLKEVQELLGHSEQRTTEIYAHIDDDHLADIAEVNLGPMDLGNGRK